MMFRITDGKGFQIILANGWEVSVQFGPGNYCDAGNRSAPLADAAKCGAIGSKTAELAIFNSSGAFVRCEYTDGSEVAGFVSPDDVAKAIAWAASQPD